MTGKSLLLTIVLMLGTGCTQSIWVTPGNVGPTIMYPDWTQVQAGVDFKQVVIPTAGTVSEIFDIVRIDPKQAQLQIAVDEAIPKTVSTWQEQLGASVLINASYFDDNFHLLTKTITPTESYGQVLSDKTGVVFAVDNQWNIKPWRNDPITATWAVQSYPMLVDKSRAVFTAGSANTAQRTVIAQDATGMLYFIIAEQGVLSLAQLSNILAQQFPVSLTEALNFDGGTSTGLVIHSSQVIYQDDSLVVPAVVYLKP